MASLSQTQVNSNCVLNFHSDAYNMDADMVGAVGRRLSIEGFFSCPIRRHFVYLEGEVLVPMIRLILERGGKRIHVKRIDSMLYAG